MPRLKKLTLALSAGASLATLQSAMAQDDAPAAAKGVDVIVVSAQKRDEGQQDVPVSVTAFSQNQLDMMGARSLAGVQEATPNLNFTIQSADSNNARVTLRGIGTETLVGGGDPGVALHIDGVYVGRNSAAAIDLFDLERIEVLRGPQGTLYGRNATGGSINIITKKPENEFGGYADATYGNYNQLRVRGVVNAPLADNVYARFSLFSDRHDGYIENLSDLGRDVADKDSHGGRVQLLWEPNSRSEILLRGYYSKIGGAGPGTRFLGTDIGTSDGYPADYLVGISDGSGFPAGPPAGIPIGADVYHNIDPSLGNAVLALPSDLHQVRKDANEFLDQVIKGADIEANFDLTDAVAVRSITSYQENDSNILVDADGSELPIETRQTDTSAQQFSQEINLLSQSGSAFQWLLGAYFYHEELTELFETNTPSGLLPLTLPLPPGAVAGGGGVFQMQTGNHKTNSYALFGQVSYDLTDRLKITAGGRHTWDDKEQSRFGGGLRDATNDYRLLAGGATGPINPDTGKTSFSEWTWRFTADYAVSDDNLLYASYSHGYKSGGFDFNGGLLDGANLLEYQPEFVDAYEVGSKNIFFDNKLLMNLAGFYYDYKDLQVFRLTALGPATENAASSTIWGVELEMQAAVSDALRFDGTVGYLDATYDEFLDGANDWSGNRLNNAPKWTAHLGAEYTVPAGENDLIARVDWSYRSDIYFDKANTNFDVQEAYSLVNARLRYDADKWYLDLFANNIADKDYVTGQLINPPFSCGCRTVNIGAPRTYGVTAGVRF